MGLIRIYNSIIKENCILKTRRRLNKSIGNSSLKRLSNVEGLKYFKESKTRVQKMILKNFNRFKEDQNEYEFYLV